MEKHKYNFMAYDASNNERDLFETFEQAAAWLREASDEFLSEETIAGDSFVATITHRTGFVETDRRENYHEHNEECPPDCDGEEWPHDADVVGEWLLLPVADTQSPT